MKPLLLCGIAIVCAAVAGAMLSRSRGVRQAARALLALLSLALACLTAFCFVFPLFAPRDSNAGFLMFPGVITGVLAYVVWTMYSTAQTYEKVQSMPDEQKVAWVQDTAARMAHDLQEELARDEREVEKFWISPKRRRQLRERIQHNRFMLEKLPKLALPRHLVHSDKKAPDK
jgi:hypothetical protein